MSVPPRIWTGSFRASPLLGIVAFAFVLVCGYEAARFILADDMAGLVYAGLAFLVAAFVVAMLNSWMSDIKTGQRLTFVRLPGTGIQVSVNGTVKGTITGDDFSRAFFSIWLGKEPPNPELKMGLLGGPCD